MDKQGNTTSHVFRGAVKLQRLIDDKPLEQGAIVLHEDESARVDTKPHGPLTKLDLSADPAFVRTMPRKNGRALDLVDVVAGGYGFSEKCNRGINPTNGAVATSLDVKAQSPLLGDGLYHRVTNAPFVDGVFIPDGGKAEVQVDSAGHQFDGFRKTENSTWHPIWAAGTLPANISAQLDSSGFAKPRRLLFLHASNAITFDLDAIRHANPGFRLMRFRATTGNLAPGQEYGVVRTWLADVWVLVDGRSRFRRQRIDAQSGPLDAVVHIGEHDRFLTLAATDGDDGISHDWIVLGSPRIEMAPTRNAGGNVDTEAKSE